jgi:hypothetical protein
MPPKSRDDTVHYISTMLRDLRRSAEDAKLTELAYLLSLAEAEAKQAAAIPESVAQSEDR